MAAFSVAKTKSSIGRLRGVAIDGKGKEIKITKESVSKLFSLDTYKNLFNGFVMGFIYTALILLSLTGLYFLGYYIGQMIS